MSYEITLRKLLESEDKELHGRLLHLEKSAQQLLIYAHGKFPYYTPHDFQHSLSVEENLNWIILDNIKEELNKYEIFFLICAAWLHDWGMIGEKDEKPEEIRENHHVRTEDYFETKYSTLGFTSHEGIIIGRICKGHRKIDLYSEEYEDMTFGQGIRIRTRFLAALLRIADETDVTHSRTPEAIYHTINPSGKSKEEFKKHLSITGIGQFDEPHKIYINAIARDPRGAKTLRKLASKIQLELDTVKNILAQNGLNLDVIELKLETRGFIDKAIGFEVNKNKIVDLLIGKHLYGKLDVSIRELVQNSIDACSYKKLHQNNYSPQISLTRENEDTLTISDNGIGMNYFEAKRFLSNVGISFYNSDEFIKTSQDIPYDPISFFGIGLLSAFLIADGLVIETKKKNEDACKFTIASLSDDWKYEKGSLKSPGTSITLNLNEEGKKILILESLNRYFVNSEIPIVYAEFNGEEKKFDSIWSIDAIVERFIKNKWSNEKINTKSIMSFNKNKYDVNLVCIEKYQFHGQLILFNHGVFVKSINIIGLSGEYYVFLNLKSNLVDLHISRENIIENNKWFSFLNNLFNELLDEIQKSCSELNFLSITSSLIEDRINYDKSDFNRLFEKSPFLNSIFSKIIFPLVTNGSLEWASFKQIMEDDEILSLYKCNSHNYMEEIALFCEDSKQSKTFFNPYKMPTVGETHDCDKIDIVEYCFKQKKHQYEKIDLRSILLNISKPTMGDYSNILPQNVQFASFGNLKPLVVIREYIKIEEENPHLGSSYWGNILLWDQLIEKDRRNVYLKSILDDGRYESMKIVEEPIVFVDATDTFISSIIDRYESLTIEECQIIYRYFKYLSYLPLVIHNMESCLIFIEVIENIEESLSKSFGLNRPKELFTRMKPNSFLYLQYFKGNNLYMFKNAR